MFRDTCSVTRANEGLPEAQSGGLSARAPPPVFFVSVASKRFSFAVSHLESTLTRVLISVASKGLDAWQLRLKTGKTRYLSATADSKELRSESAQKTQEKEQSNAESESEQRFRREDAERGEAADRCWSLANTGQNSMPVSTC